MLIRGVNAKKKENKHCFIAINIVEVALVSLRHVRSDPDPQHPRDLGDLVTQLAEPRREGRGPGMDP